MERLEDLGKDITSVVKENKELNNCVSNTRVMVEMVQDYLSEPINKELAEKYLEKIETLLRSRGKANV